MQKHRLFSLFAGIFLAFSSLSVNAQSGEIRDLRNFESLLIHPGFDVELVRGTQPSVEIQGYDLDPSEVHVSVSNHKLEVYHHNFRPPWNNRVGGRWDSQVHGKLIITYVYLEGIDFRGDGLLTCEDELSAETFQLKLYGDGEVQLPRLRTGLLKAALYGDIRLIAGGQAYEQRWRGYGDIRADAKDLRGEFADVKLYGDSELLLDIRDELALTVLGDGTIHYKGSPSIQRRLVLGEASLYHQP